MLDLGDAGDAHPERRGHVFLREAELLAGLGKLVPPVLGKQPARSRLDLLGSYARRVEFFFQGFPVSAADHARRHPEVVNVGGREHLGIQGGSAVAPDYVVGTSRRYAV